MSSNYTAPLVSGGVALQAWREKLRWVGWLLCDTAGVVGWVCLSSTGSPFGHHPRLRMVCPLWGQWVSMWRRFACLCFCISCIVCRHSHHLSSSAASTQRYSRLWRSRTASIEHPHKSTLASGGGAPCLTAGDARRVNPWKEDREKSDAGGVALQALREYLLSPSQEKRNFCCHTIVTHRHTYNMHAFRYLYSQCDNVTTEK